MWRVDLVQPGEGCFWGHLTAPPVPTRGHQGDRARLLAVVRGRRATMGTS